MSGCLSGGFSKIEKNNHRGSVRLRSAVAWGSWRRAAQLPERRGKQTKAGVQPEAPAATLTGWLYSPNEEDWWIWWAVMLSDTTEQGVWQLAHRLATKDSQRWLEEWMKRQEWRRTKQKERKKGKRGCYLEGLEALQKGLGLVCVLFCLAGIRIGVRRQPGACLRLSRRRGAVLFGAIVLLEFILTHTQQDEVRWRERRKKNRSEKKRMEKFGKWKPEQMGRKRGMTNVSGQDAKTG